MDEATSTLTFEEARVLGCLIEKEITTPDYYPMTLAAVTAACNQKSNRSPVVEWEEGTVQSALDGLRQRRLAVMLHVAGARVPKFKHSLENVYGGIDRAMKAILCELLVRNVQTLGELRTRAERMNPFPSLEATEECVMRLVNYGMEPLAVVLPPGGGRRVKAYAHLLSGIVETIAVETPAVMAAPPSADWRAGIEAELAALRADVERLKEAVARPG